MNSELLSRNLSVLSFKRKYPRLYKKIIKLYGGRENIFDVQAAIELYLKKIPHPHCEICDIPLTITKKYRKEVSHHRCFKHINTNNIIDIETIINHNVNNYEILEIPKNPSKSSNITIRCGEHGPFTQTINNFLKGMRCQKCYSNNRTPRVDFQSWVSHVTAHFNNFYDYSLVDYVKLESDITIICPIHGEFTQKAGAHYHGHGCIKCGYDNNKNLQTMTSEDFIEKAKQIHNNLYDYSLVKYQNSRAPVKIKCNKHGVFDQVAYYHLAGNGCQQCGIQKTTFKSAAEYELIDFLSSIGITNIEHSYRNLGFELDIYLPEYNLAIEYNGIYWHSSGSKETDKKCSVQHLDKTLKCEQNGIHLLHILDIEWNNPIKKEIWKSIIRYKTKKITNRIHGRKCKIAMVDHKQAERFFNENHIQGSVSGLINIGLIHDNKLVSLANFSKSRYRRNNTTLFELLRFSSLKNHTVIGGFTKILKDFDKNHTGSLISYANRRWSNGDIYKKSNFALDKVTKPCYYYTDCKRIWHRSIFQKHKLSKLLENFDTNKTEWENMYNHNYRRIWDCGHYTFIKDIQ